MRAVIEVQALLLHIGIGIVPAPLFNGLAESVVGNDHQAAGDALVVIDLGGVVPDFGIAQARLLEVPGKLREGAVEVKAAEVGRREVGGAAEGFNALEGVGNLRIAEGNRTAFERVAGLAEGQGGDVVGPVRVETDRAATDEGGLERSRRADLPLDAEGELMHLGSVEVRLEPVVVAADKGRRAEAGAGGDGNTVGVGIAEQAGERIAAAVDGIHERGVGGEAGGLQEVVIRVEVVEPVAAADDRFVVHGERCADAALEVIQVVLSGEAGISVDAGELEATLQVAQFGIEGQVGRGDLLGNGAGESGVEAAVLAIPLFVGSAVVVPAETHIQGQAAGDLPVVLEIRSEVPLPVERIDRIV